MKSKIYFTKNITPESLVRIYEALGVNLKGDVAVKLHSGEEGNQNYIKPEMVKNLVDKVNGTVVECNTAYEGARDTSEKHLKLMESHGWSKYFDVDILDEFEDKEILIPNGQTIKKNYIGKKIENYDSILVLSHFKGHPMGGFGGALKQLSIGFASSKGKRYIHCVGAENGTYEMMFQVDQNKFLESMADAASSIHNMYKDNIVYINVLCNLSVDCDCCSVAANPCMKDIGILISTDPIAIDKASLDMIYNSSDPGKDEMIERIESRNGRHIIDAALKLGFGTTDYELIDID